MFLQEDLTPESTKKVLDAFSKGVKPKPGPQSGRRTSENSAGLTTLASKVSYFLTFKGGMMSDSLSSSKAIRPRRVLCTRIQVVDFYNTTGVRTYIYTVQLNPKKNDPPCYENVWRVNI